jgi:hypothetical protein
MRQKGFKSPANDCEVSQPRPTAGKQKQVARSLRSRRERRRVKVFIPAFDLCLSIRSQGWLYAAAEFSVHRAHPGWGATNPLVVNQPGKILKDAAMFGLRTVLKF